MAIRATQGGHQVTPDTKRKLALRKRNLFVIEKYVKEVRQGQKIDPDLLESIMKLSDPVKETLRRISFKLSQFRSRIINIKVSTFWIPEKSRIPAGGQHSKRV